MCQKTWNWQILNKGFTWKESQAIQRWDSNLHCNELSELSLNLHRSYFFNTSPSVGRKERMRMPTHSPTAEEQDKLFMLCTKSKQSWGQRPNTFWWGGWLQQHQNHQHDQCREAHTALLCTFLCHLNTLTCTNSPLRIKPYFCPLYFSLG